MKGIKNIIFDLGGVIINLDNQRTEAAFTAMGAKNFSDYFGHGFAASFFKDYEIGKIGDIEFIDQLKAMIGPEATDEKVVEAWNALLLDFPPERIALLKKLAGQYRIFLFSNTNALHLAALQKIYRETFSDGELDDHFEKTYYSHILRLRKPEVASYDYIIKENNLIASETLFVDDALVNIEGAKAAGLQGLYLEPGTTITDVIWEN